MIEYNEGFVIAAYGATWLVLLAYVVRLVRKTRRAVAEHERMMRESTGEHRI